MLLPPRTKAARKGPHQHRQDRDRPDRNRRDQDRRAQAHPPDEGQAGGEQARDGHHHDRSGGDDRRSRSLVRHSRGVRHVVTGGQLFSVAPDYEQRVVDPGAEAEHHPERRGKARKIEHRRAEREQHDAARQREQGGEQGEEHRGGGSEDQRQDEHRDRYADQVPDRGRLLFGLVDDLAAPRHLHAVALGARAASSSPIVPESAVREGRAPSAIRCRVRRSRP